MNISRSVAIFGVAILTSFFIAYGGAESPGGLPSALLRIDSRLCSCV